VPNLTIEERLLHYFLAMGAQPTEALQDAPPGLSIIIGSEKAHIAVLKNDAFLHTGKIIESIMSLNSLKNRVNQLYLAAPRLLGTTVEAGLFRSSGIGLILFDDRRIDETVTPKSFHQQDAQPVQSHDNQLLQELNEVKSMYLEMEKNFSSLRDEVRSYQERMKSLATMPERISSPMLSPHEPIHSGSSAGLPSFFADNPWLEVLSRRGREEGSAFAG
jgi:FtsZ-binding cell division protein ZapB